MARRTTKTAPTSAPESEAAPAVVPVTYIANPISLSSRTPTTRHEIAVRDAVRTRLAAVEAAVADFVLEKTTEGFSLGEIDQLYALEVPLMLSYVVDGSKIRASYDAQIVERAG